MSSPIAQQAPAATKSGEYVRDASLGQLGGTLTETVEKIQSLMLKIQGVVQMIFDEVLARLALVMSCCTSFSVCISNLQAACCPKPVAQPALAETVKELIASFSTMAVPRAPSVQARPLQQ